MSNKNIESTELRQDTTMKQTDALEARIKYFQEQQSSQVPGKLLDIVAKSIITVSQVGKAIEKILPEETHKKLLELYHKILLAF